MLSAISVKRIIIASSGLVVVLLVVGWITREDPADKPYLKIAGSGFVFNYRVADVTYGFTAIVIKPLPVGSTIEACFQDPAGGPDHLVRKRVGTDSVRYGFQSPSVRGVIAGKPYRVSVRVFDRQGEQELWQHAFVIKSQISDSVMPDKPLTIGPGYTPNPDR